MSLSRPQNRLWSLFSWLGYVSSFDRLRDLTCHLIFTQQGIKRKEAFKVASQNKCKPYVYQEPSYQASNLKQCWFFICPRHLTGRYVRNICIYGIEDLPWIIQRNSMFANKFEGKSFPEALDCLEQWHRGKVLRQATVPIEPEWLLAIPHVVPTSNTNSSGEQ